MVSLFYVKIIKKKLWTKIGENVIKTIKFKENNRSSHILMLIFAICILGAMSTWAKEKDSDYAVAYKYIIEEVAYTWFNRLIAVRFMEVNDYLPTRTRVLPL